MRRLKIIAAVAVVVAVTGCATAEGYRQRMDLMAGYHSDQLQVEWGPPDRVSELTNGNELWVYRKITVRHSGNSYSQVPNGSYQEKYKDKKGNVKIRTVTTYDSVWVPPEEWETYCETRFVVSPDHKVLSTGFEGSDCVAKEVKSAGGED
jgi:hypothetical protein